MLLCDALLNHTLALRKLMHAVNNVVPVPWCAAAAVARDRVANVLLAYKGKNNLGGAARAAEDIARQTAKELLGPLLDTACTRLGFVLRRSLDIAADKAMRAGQ